MTPSVPTIFFLHGLDSSSKGFKATWFANNFPQMHIHSYSGTLAERLATLEEHSSSHKELILVGSSYGGLMATCFAQRHPEQCLRLILLAPALNFAGFIPPSVQLATPTTLIIGKNDTVCPPQDVLPLAQKTFSQLTIQLAEDDHMFHRYCPRLDWQDLLGSNT